MKERIGYYDMARGLGIIFVVIGHIDSFYMPFRSVVITFHMALFFMITGMLFLETGEEKRPYCEIVKKKIGHIMLPYFLFSLLSIGIEFIRLSLQDIYHWPHFKKLILSTCNLYGNSAMWFLPALFISELLFLAVRKLKRDGVTVLILSVSTILAVWGSDLEIGKTELQQEIWIVLVRGVYCTVFIAIGYYARKYIFSRKVSESIYGMLAAVLLAVCVIFRYINPNADLRLLYWGEAWISTPSRAVLVFCHAGLYLAGAVSGALGIIFLCKALEGFRQCRTVKLLIFFGSNSLIIMGTHLDFHVLHYSMEMAEWISDFDSYPVVYHSLVLVFVFAAEAMLILLINKYLPVLAGKYKK